MGFQTVYSTQEEWPPWSGSYGSWINNVRLPVHSVPIIIKAVSSNTTHGEVCSVYQYVIKCDRSVVSSTNKTDHHYITVILFKVALNSITLTINITTDQGNRFKYSLISIIQTPIF